MLVYEVLLSSAAVSVSVHENFKCRDRIISSKWDLYSGSWCFLRRQIIDDAAIVLAVGTGRPW